MKLFLKGHDDRYAVEQLQLSLFPGEAMEPVCQSFTGDGAVSALLRGKTWLTAVTAITRNGKTTRGMARLKAGEETVRLRRRALQQSYYRAALPHLDAPPPWVPWRGYAPPSLPPGAF